MEDFGRKVKAALALNGKNQKWLMAQVGKVYDGNLNPVVMSLAINKGNNVYPQVKLAIAHVLGIKI